MKKIFGPTIIVAAICMSPGAIADAWQHHRLDARAVRAGKALNRAYVRTESETIHIASAYAFDGKICVTLSASGPAFQSGDEASTEMAYAVFNADGQTYRYNLNRDEFDESCEGASAAGINVLVAVEHGAEGAR